MLQDPPQNGKKHGTVTQGSVIAERIRENATILFGRGDRHF
jgi:hypothetical protein